MLARAGKAQAGAATKDSRPQVDRCGRDKLQEGPQLHERGREPYDTGSVVWVHDGHSRKVFDAFFEQISIKGREPIDLVSADGTRWVDDAIVE